MSVCVCNVTTDHEIKETVAVGVVTMSNPQTQLGVATCRGYCSRLAAPFLSGAGTQIQGPVTAGINVQC